jgi:TRAP-type C4-dicarboxylate transport system, large permease component
VGDVRGLTPIGFLIMVNIVLLVAGSFMEPSAIILILAPIFFPIAMKLGIDPIHLGIVMVVNMEIGLVHPPVGLNLFVTSAVTGLTLGADDSRGAAVAVDPAAVPGAGDLCAVHLAGTAGVAWDAMTIHLKC